MGVRIVLNEVTWELNEDMQECLHTPLLYIYKTNAILSILVFFELVACISIAFNPVVQPILLMLAVIKFFYVRCYSNSRDGVSAIRFCSASGLSQHLNFIKLIIHRHQINFKMCCRWQEICCLCCRRRSSLRPIWVIGWLSRNDHWTINMWMVS